jgi:ADP-ribosylglycohydrolase
MLGAIAGDIIGSAYEHAPIKTTGFPLFQAFSRFTDDTVLTVAVADALLHGGDYDRFLADYYHRYPFVPYGGLFHAWARSNDRRPYNSWGNGSAMRVSPVAYALPDMDSVLREARLSAEVTHNHPEGIRGAQATALAVFLARKGASKREIREAIQGGFGYDLSRHVDDIRPDYQCDLSCQHTVPEAMICFLESSGFEDAVRKAVSLGGDADTMACITGAVAEPFYGGVPEHIRREARLRLDQHLLGVLDRFAAEYRGDCSKRKEEL